MKVTLDLAIKAADEVVMRVEEGHFGRPTPCSDWNVRQLLNHIINEVAWIPEMLAGKTIAEVGDALDGDLIGDDLRHSWKAYSETALEAAEQTPPHKVVRLSYGNVPAEEYLQEVSGDIIIHTWDLARGIGAPFHIDESVALAIYDRTKDKISDWRKSGLVGEQVPVPPDASAEVKLLGLFGRKA